VKHSNKDVTEQARQSDRAVVIMIALLVFGVLAVIAIMGRIGRLA